jgi:uncharacterized protein YodC (DUF2158 family)
MRQPFKVGDVVKRNETGAKLTIIGYTKPEAGSEQCKLRAEDGYTRWVDREYLDNFYTPYTYSDQPLSTRVAELEAELAALKAEKAKPEYDYKNPKAGDLLRDERDKSLNMVMASCSSVPMSVVCIHGYRTGHYLTHDRGFDACEHVLTFLGNMNDSPNLLKESIP